jgi:hypothetical protein
VISTLLLLVLPFPSACSFIRFLNNQPRGVLESPPELGSLRGSNFVLSVDEVLDEEPFTVEFDEDEDEDEDILDNGDLPGLLGRGAAIASSVTGGGTDVWLTGEEDTLCDNQ